VRTKFQVSIFSRSRDLTGSQTLKVGYPSLYCRGSGSTSNTTFRVPPQVFTPKSILICSAVFQRSRDEPHDRRTDRLTDAHKLTVSEPRLGAGLPVCFRATEFSINEVPVNSDETLTRRCNRLYGCCAESYLRTACMPATTRVTQRQSLRTISCSGGSGD